MLPKLYIKGVLEPVHPKSSKSELDNYVPIHYIMEVINYKLKKENPNIHDRLFMLKSMTGTGKSTSLIIEVHRRFIGKNYSKFSGETKDKLLSYTTTLPTDLSIFNFPDDPHTIKNRKNGIPTFVNRKNVILCTQPKVLTARGKAIEISNASYAPDLELGENVSYATGPFKQPMNSRKGIQFSTLGSFIQKIKLNTSKDIC